MDLAWSDTATWKRFPMKIPVKSDPVTTPRPNPRNFNRPIRYPIPMARQTPISGYFVKSFANHSMSNSLYGIPHEDQSTSSEILPSDPGCLPTPRDTPHLPIVRPDGFHLSALTSFTTAG